MLTTSLFLGLLAASPAPDALQRLSWMQGCWAAQGGEAGTGEHWMAPAGGTMLGMGRTVRKGTTTEFEFFQIRELDGKLVYMAQPMGRSPTNFVLKADTDGEAVFENLANDFPHRVIYRRAGAAALHARIEGVVRGKPKAIDFPFTRSACPT